MATRKSSTATKKRTTRSRSRGASTVLVSDTRLASMESPEPRMESTDVITSQLPNPPQEPEPTPEPTPMPDPMPGPQETVMSCTNCSHIPMGVNAVVTMLVALVFTLSTLVVASTLVIDSQQFQIQAFNDVAS